MRAALVGAVDFNGGHFTGEAFDCVIAVDRGFASLKQVKVIPDVAVGDFDSLGSVPEGPVRCFPAEKDESDMELGIAEALSRGCDELLIYGALSARLDHTIANLQLLVGLARRDVRAYGIGDGFVVCALHGGSQKCGRIAFSGAALECAGLAAGTGEWTEDVAPAPSSHASDAHGYGNFISVFAVSCCAQDVTERGLKWELSHAVLSDDTSRGLSNEFIADDAFVKVGDGDLLVTFPLAAWPALLRS